jgi:hypothetical protein
MVINPELIYEVYTDHDYPEVEAWCVENVGLWNEDWYREPLDLAVIILSGSSKTRYFFKTEQDKIMFILRWS